MPNQNQLRADAGPPTTTMRMGAGNKFTGMLDRIRNENQMGIRDLIEMNARQGVNTMSNMMGNAGGVFMQGMGMAGIPGPFDNVGQGLNVLRNEAQYAGPMLGQAAGNVLGNIPGARSNPETDLGARTGRGLMNAAGSAGRQLQDNFDRGKKFLNEFTGFALPYMGNDGRSRVY